MSRVRMQSLSSVASRVEAPETIYERKNTPALNQSAVSLHRLPIPMGLVVLQLEHAVLITENMPTKFQLERPTGGSCRGDLRKKKYAGPKLKCRMLIARGNTSVPDGRVAHIASHSLKEGA